MLKEYAVDPSAIASGLQNCRYLISQFGVDKGRLISNFPSRWKRLAIEATDQLPDGLNKERIVEYISSINNDWLTLVPSGRDYPFPGDEWLKNSIEADRQKPFDAIISTCTDIKHHVFDAEEIDDSYPEFKVDRIQPIFRTKEGLAGAASFLLKNCRRLKLIDPHFKFNRPKWRSALKAYFSEIPDIKKVIIQIHTLEKDESPILDELKKHLKNLEDVIPEHGLVKIIRWKELEGGERFHGRYILTENAGLNYEGGLDVGNNEAQTTDVSLLTKDLHEKHWNAFDVNASVFELVEPTLMVDAHGGVKEL